MVLGDGDECSRRARRLSAALLPVLDRSHGDSEYCGELSLREPHSQAGGRGSGKLDAMNLTLLPLPHLAHGFEQLLAEIAMRIAFPQCFIGKLHGQFPSMVSRISLSRFAQSFPSLPWNKSTAARYVLPQSGHGSS